MQVVLKQKLFQICVCPRDRQSNTHFYGVTQMHRFFNTRTAGETDDGESTVAWKEHKEEKAKGEVHIALFLNMRHKTISY